MQGSTPQYIVVDRPARRHYDMLHHVALIMQQFASNLIQEAVEPLWYFKKGSKGHPGTSPFSQYLALPGSDVDATLFFGNRKGDFPIHVFLKVMELFLSSSEVKVTMRPRWMIWSEHDQQLRRLHAHRGRERLVLAHVRHYSVVDGEVQGVVVG